MASASGIYSEPGTALIASPTDFKREPLRLHVTLAQQLRPHAPGLTPRSVIDKFAAVQMLDVEIPTTDGRTLSLTRYTEPEAGALLGIGRHVLRDCRLRGELRGRLVGKRILYERGELLRFLREA